MDESIFLNNIRRSLLSIQTYYYTSIAVQLTDIVI